MLAITGILLRTTYPTWPNPARKIIHVWLSRATHPLLYNLNTCSPLECNALSDRCPDIYSSGQNDLFGEKISSVDLTDVNKMFGGTRSHWSVRMCLKLINTHWTAWKTVWVVKLVGKLADTCDLYIFFFGLLELTLKSQMCKMLTKEKTVTIHNNYSCTAKAAWVAHNLLLTGI